MIIRPPPFPIDNVLKLRKRGLSLRAIADETSLSLNTVCTIIGNQTKTTRARRKRYERIQPDKFADASWQSRSRTRDALPKRINAVIETGQALVKEARGWAGDADSGRKPPGPTTPPRK